MRKSDIFLLSLAAQALVLCLLFFHASYRTGSDMPSIMEKGRMVKALELTDLCLFTEARYTRHITQADLNTPFQDHPMSLEHFPSGSFIMPPENIFRAYAPQQARK